MESDAVRRPLRRRDVPQAVWLLAGLALASVGIGVLFVAKGNDTGTGATAPAARAKKGAGPKRSTCGIWPQVESFVPPPGAVRPGVHVWVDVKRWHVRLVPAAGLDAISGTVTVAGGGATEVAAATGHATPAGGGARIDLGSPPSSAGAAYEATWKVPCSANQVTVDVRDGAGHPVTVDQLDIGAGFPAKANPLTFQR